MANYTLLMGRNKTLSVVGDCPPVFLGENEADELYLLFPQTYAGTDLIDCSVLFHIINPLNVEDVIELETIIPYDENNYGASVQISEMYTCDTGRYSVYLEVTKNDGLIVKSSTAYFDVNNAYISGAYVPEEQLTLLPQWQNRMNETYEFVQEKETEISESAEEAHNWAQTANEEADRAQEQALSAESSANVATASAGQAQTQKEIAQEAADEALDNMEGATTQANRAREAADEALISMNETTAQANRAREAANQALNSLQGAIEQADRAREAASDSLDSAEDATTQASGAREAAVDALNSAEEATSQADRAREAADEAEAFTDEKVREEAVARENADLSEAQTRESADIILQSSIVAEETAREAADTALQADIAAEIIAREAADTDLQVSLTAEVSARELTDTSLESEIMERQTGDTVLQANIDAKADIYNEDDGFSGGNGATADGGGAIGALARSNDGGAMGYTSRSTYGGAVGYRTITSDGFAGGKNAKTQQGTTAIDAIQLGAGTNSNVSTLQIYDNQLLDADGNIPIERMTAETTAREAADATLQTNITTEATARGVADATLQTNIDTKADAQTEQGGFAGGVGATATIGGAIGRGATATMGGAVGRQSVTSTGFAGGVYAKTMQDGTAINAIQLGTGTNPNPNTLQIYNNQLLDADGNIPIERMTAETELREAADTALQNSIIANMPKTTVSNGYIPYAIGGNVLDYVITGGVGGLGDLNSETGKYDITIKNRSANILNTHLMYSSYLSGGITYTNNMDGTITANGTMTGTFSSFPMFTSVNIPTFQVGTKYYLSTPAVTNDTRVSVALFISINTVGGGVRYVSSRSGGNFTLAVGETITVTPDVRITSTESIGFVADNLVLKPMISEVPSDFQPYREPTETVISLDAPLTETKRITLSDTETDIPLLEGGNVLYFDTTVQPSSVSFTFHQNLDYKLQQIQNAIISLGGNI